MRPSLALTPGTRLGVYQVTAAIGEGGMGAVFRARDTKLDREVALKFLPSSFAEDPERLARFEREAKLLASLNHTSIAHVYGFESATLDHGKSVHFLAMELVDGEDLARMVETVEHPVLGGLRMLGTPFKLDATPTSVRRAPPTLNQHADEILREELGYDDARIAALREQKII